MSYKIVRNYDYPDLIFVFVDKQNVLSDGDDISMVTDFVNLYKKKLTQKNFSDISITVNHKPVKVLISKIESFKGTELEDSVNEILLEDEEYKKNEVKDKILKMKSTHFDLLTKEQYLARKKAENTDATVLKKLEEKMNLQAERFLLRKNM